MKVVVEQSGSVGSITIGELGFEAELELVFTLGLDDSNF